jgi:glycosyltransferase involved in cell wall biosynthesis
MVECVRALRAGSVRSAVVLPKDGPLRGMLEEAGAEVHVAPFRWWADAQPRLLRRVARPALQLVALPRLARLVRALEPDVVVTNTMASPAGALAARAAGVPHVWYVHEFGWEDHGLVFDLGRRAAYALVNRLSARVLVISEAVRAHVSARVAPWKVRRVSNAAEVPGSHVRLARSPGERVRLVQVGQKSPGKGQHDAIRALALLAARGVDAELWLVGRDDHPEYGPHLRALADELGVAARVRNIDFTPEATRLMGEADAVLVCSRAEAFGRVTVEAMKIGTPVVGARSGGTAELIRDGWNGLTYPPGDAEALAAALERLCRDPQLWDTLAENGRRWASAEFTLERTGAQLAAALQEAVSGER